MTKNLDNEGIADNYQLFYVDLWGVVHNGVTLILHGLGMEKVVIDFTSGDIYLKNYYCSFC